MTKPKGSWLDWEAVKAIPDSDANSRHNAAQVNGPLVSMLNATQVSCEYLELPTKGHRFGASLGKGHGSQGRPLWEAQAGLSVVTASQGVRGLSNLQLASFREGLNLWLYVFAPQSKPDLQIALRQPEARQALLEGLLALPLDYQPQISVNAAVSNHAELRTEFRKVAKSKSPGDHPFKNTFIIEENKALLIRLLEIYADAGQTFLRVSLLLPSDVFQYPEEQVAAKVKPMLKALDRLAGLWTSISTGSEMLKTPAQSKAKGTAMSTVVTELLNLTRFTRNIILYGPPGTGKTYAVQQFQNAFLGEHSTGSAEPVDVGRLPRWQAIALTLYGSPEPLSVTAMLEEQPLARYEAIRAAKTPYASVMTELIEHGVDISDVPVSIKSKRSPTVFQKQPNRTWTLTADGRELVERTLLGQPTAEWSLSPEARSRFITFHPSFAYEEFVEGLRPETDEEGRLQYRVRPGQFKEICQDAEKELHEAAQAGRPPRKFLLVIDEINRANIAKVFGELMTLIEDGKRVDNEGGGYAYSCPTLVNRSVCPKT